MKLKAPKGCGGVSWEGQEYPVIDGLVEVPDGAGILLEPGYGFTLINADPEALEPKTKSQKLKTGT